MKQKKKIALNKPVSRKDLFKANDILLNVIFQMVITSLGDTVTEYIATHAPSNEYFMDEFKKYMDEDIKNYLEQLETCYKKASNDTGFSKIIENTVIKPYMKNMYKTVKRTFAKDMKG